MNNVKMMLSVHWDRASLYFQNMTEPLQEVQLYRDWHNSNMGNYLAEMQYSLNWLGSFMNDKFETNRHFNAAESRELLDWIEMWHEDTQVLSGTSYAYVLAPTYADWLVACDKFLQKSDGSEVPSDYHPLVIQKYAAICTPANNIKLRTNNINRVSTLKLKGEGAYAKVYRYKDYEYNCWVGLKQLKKSSTPEEIVRFRREFDELARLNSPYILKVYRFDTENNHYSMEWGTCTLQEYLRSHAELSQSKRKSIAHQILAGIRYLHTRGLLHRDISLNNIIIFEYDDAVIAKVSDLGLVKEINSDLTRQGTEVKGTFIDPCLELIGFENYKICNEMYSLTKLLYFVMTNRTRMNDFPNISIQNFVHHGIDNDLSMRYTDDMALLKAFDDTDWSY
ncbi:protein kinase domain-containing protein [Lacticaseibacillus jixiensis]|uniref:protein kinase domain-containing protein n=1 Tax=Lacticaseibacillus jixiensis TaxID=3231926 RepID=UPI0036F197E4